MNKAPNYALAEKMAYQVINKMNFNKLPIDLDPIIAAYSDLKIFTYTFFCEFTGWTLEEVIKRANSESGCCFYNADLNKYIILYNDTIQNEGHIRWTIAHELGHYFLKHSEITNRASFMRNSISREEYKVYESEANCFARNLLAPPSILVELEINSPKHISELCNLSKEASENIYKFITEGVRRGFSFTNKFILDPFKKFIQQKKYGKTCIKCSRLSTEKDSNFCSVCRNTSFIKEEEERMIYSRLVEFNEGIIPSCCPRCENEITVGVYCQVCGTYLINKCTGLHEDRIESYEIKHKWHLLGSACRDNLLPGDARYCASCGSTSTFHEQGLFQEWKKELDEWIKQQEDIAKFEEQEKAIKVLA